MNTHSSLTHYYRFDASDIQGTTVLNYATGTYDGKLLNGATVSSSSGSYKVGTSALSLVSTGNAGTSPYFEINNGITIGGTAMTFACWYDYNIYYYYFYYYYCYFYFYYYCYFY